MLRVARIVTVSEGKGGVDLELVEGELKIDTERITEPSVRRALAGWVVKHGQPEQQYVAVDLATGPVRFKDEVQVTRIVTSADGTEITRAVRQEGDGQAPF